MLTSEQIKHVFVLMLENHSFDQMLGFSGISGTDAETGQLRTIVSPSGYTNPVNGIEYKVGTPGINPMLIDPGHEFPDVVVQLGGVNAKYPPGGPYPPIINTGFAVNYTQQESYKTTRGVTPGDPLQCYSKAQVPVINELAQNFVLCDAWFSSMPGPTWPNRFFVHAASSGGLDHSPSTDEILWYVEHGYAFENGTIFDSLEHNKVPWRIYRGDIHPQALALKNVSLLSENLVEYTRFDKDVNDKSGYPPVYTFIEPNYGMITTDYTCGTSQHPLDDITRGEWLIKCTYESIRNSPVWDSSLLIITWDEHGGFFDHVAPPTAVPPGDTTQPQNPLLPPPSQYGFEFDVYGVRVASVIVSPWIPPNILDGRTYDHTTVLATVERLYGLNPLTQRDAMAADLLSLGTTEPRQGAPEELTSPGTRPQKPQCPPINNCTDLPSSNDSIELLRTRPAPPEPLEGNQPGFVHAALMHDLAVSPPAEHDERRAAAASVRTKEDARRYLLEVAERVQAAE